MEDVQVLGRGKEEGELNPPLEASDAHTTGHFTSISKQWSKYCRNGRAMFVWHTFCLVVDTIAQAYTFVYGWFVSSIPWPFIIPAVSYAAINVGSLLTIPAFGPLRTAAVFQPIGPLMALQQIYFTLAAVFLPTNKKPFSRVWPGLLTCAVLALSGRTLATIATTDTSDPGFKYFKIVRHGIIGGAIAAIRNLDSLTDLQVGSLLVEKAREATCTWKGQEASCSRMMGLAVAQMVMALVDFFIGMYLQFHDMKLAAETAITPTKLAVHLTSLLCEVGMMCIYIISTIYLQPEDEGSEDPTATPGTVFFANLYGMGRMLMVILRASAKVRSTISRASQSLVSAVQKSHTRMSHASTVLLNPTSPTTVPDSTSCTTDNHECTL